MPDAVNMFIQESNIVKVRKIQSDIKEFYAIDASKHDVKNKLKIRKIYDMIPSMMENKKKRIVANKIESKKAARLSSYQVVSQRRRHPYRGVVRFEYFCGAERCPQH